jgi:hypothetical protein
MTSKTNVMCTTACTPTTRLRSPREFVAAQTATA